LSRIRTVFSFSNVIALVALFIALGGTVYAASNKISGSQIKPKSIPGNRIKAGSLSAAQLKPGTLTGSQIKAGSLTGSQIKSGSLTGTQVVGSSLTGVSASSIGTVQYVTNVVALAKEVPTGSSGTAACPSGQKVIGGGAIVGNEVFAYVNDSGPAGDRNGWSATGYSGADGVTMTITAICTPVTSALG
jgi:hypothetical protein